MDLDAFLQQIREHEGYVPHAYKDSRGYWTIGIGRLIDRRLGGGITEDEAKYLLGNDVVRFVGEMDARLPWWRDLDDVRQRVLLDMALNLGVTKLLRFHRTLAHVKAGRYVEASRAMLSSLWARQVGRRAQRLSRMMERGVDVPLD